MTRMLILAVSMLIAATSASAAEGPTASAKEGDYVVRDFKFRSGEVLAELRLHYTTLGTPQKDAQGRVTNAFMILHGTGGSGQQFFRPQFADVLFAVGGRMAHVED